MDLLLLNYFLYIYWLFFCIILDVEFNTVLKVRPTLLNTTDGKKYSLIDSCWLLFNTRWWWSVFSFYLKKSPLLIKCLLFPFSFSNDLIDCVTCAVVENGYEYTISGPPCLLVDHLAVCKWFNSHAVRIFRVNNFHLYYCILQEHNILQLNLYKLKKSG